MKLTRLLLYSMGSMALAVASWTALAQDDEPQAPEAGTPVPLETLWQEAKQLAESAEYEAAADRYQAILSQSTKWKKRQKLN